MDDQSKMTRERAVKLLGCNSSKRTVENMRIALSLHAFNNTAEEKERLSAAKLALRNWPAFEQAQEAFRKMIRQGVG